MFPIAAACTRKQRMRVMMAENGEQKASARVPIGRCKSLSERHGPEDSTQVHSDCMDVRHCFHQSGVSDPCCWDALFPELQCR